MTETPKKTHTPAIIQPDLLPSVKTGKLLPRDQALDEINEDLVKVGHPDHQGIPTGLSEDEERRMGPSGTPNADGLLWGDPEAHTGLRLAMAGTFEIDEPVLAPKVVSETIGLNGLHFEVAIVSVLKPRSNEKAFGAYMELPSDLGRDEIKQDYCGAWIITTAAEIFQEAVRASGGKWRGLPNPEGFDTWLRLAANQLIARTGL